jgi:predicted nucleic acid-binding protein
LIVVDASVVVTALLVHGREGDAAREVLLEEELHAPHLLDVEAASAVRRWVLRGQLAADTAGSTLDDLRDMAVSRHGHDLLLGRILELRDSVSAYDGCYVALAELLDAPLVTADVRLSRAPGLRCRVLLPGR